MIKPGDLVKIEDSDEGGRSIQTRKWDDQNNLNGALIWPEHGLLVVATEKYGDSSFDVLVMWNDNLGWIFDMYLTHATEEAHADAG